MKKTSVNQTIRHAQAHASRGEVGAAKELYLSLLQEFPTNKRVRQGLLDLSRLIEKKTKDHPSPALIQQLIRFLKQGQPKLVAKETAKLTRQFPTSYVLWQLAGTANKGLGRLELAEQCFQKGCEINPGLFSAYNELGISQAAQENIEDAITNFKIARALKPGDVVAHINLGNVFLQTGNFDQALESYEQASKITTDEPYVYFQIGTILFLENKFEQALQPLGKALKLEPNSSETLYRLAKVYDKLGRSDLAIQKHLSAIEVNPKFKRSFFALAKARTGLLSKEILDQLEKFESEFDETKTDEYFVAFRANVLRHKGEIEKSFELIKAANEIALNSDEIGAWEESANTVLNEVKQWSPDDSKPKSPSSNLKLLFILGPSRAGKTTIEAALNKAKNTKAGYEGWRDQTAPSHLIELAATNAARKDGKRVAGRVERLTYYSEAELQTENVEIFMCTNPAWIEFAHLIYETFDNAHFLFVERDAVSNASEIFSKFYLSKYFHSYSAKHALKYIHWYSEMCDELLGKMTDRALKIRFEDFLEDPSLLPQLIERLTNHRLDLGENFFSKPKAKPNSVYLDHYKQLLTEQT